jgi:hypothetical protein
MEMGGAAEGAIIIFSIETTPTHTTLPRKHYEPPRYQGVRTTDQSLSTEYTRLLRRLRDYKLTCSVLC